MWHFVGLFPHEHAQCVTWINYGISNCNFIADWTIVMGKISIVGFSLATSQLATTDLPERSHQPGLDFIFLQNIYWEEKCHSGIFPILLVGR